MVGRRDLLKRGAGVIAAAGIGGGIATQSAEASSPSEEDPKHLVLLVLDRSGSMSGLQAEVTKSVNEYLDEQANKRGMYIGIVQFDDNKTKAGGFCEPIFEFTPAQNTPRLGLNDYQPRGSTPLLAAVAESISKLGQIVRPIDRALMVFQTDGLENASPREITKEVIKKLITAKEAEGNWTFAFLGADIDAWGEGGSIGVRAGSTLGYLNTPVGTQSAYAVTASSTASWYATTGGGIPSTMAINFPANSNENFFDNPNITGVAPPNYIDKKPWDTLTQKQKLRWIMNNPNASA